MSSHGQFQKILSVSSTESVIEALRVISLVLSYKIFIALVIYDHMVGENIQRKKYVFVLKLEI